MPLSHREPLGLLPAVTWVVYEVHVRWKPNWVRAVCERSEWDAMELARPGYHTLVLEGITSESEAERLARGTAGDRPPRPATRL
jgi:hypothetical protein